MSTKTTETSIVAEIAAQHLGFPTLATQKVGSVDFREVAVWEVKDALEAAFRAGAASVAVPASVERRKVQARRTKLLRLNLR